MSQTLPANKAEQVKMHSDFFDRCKNAIENSFYFEAILMEYAAIESRMEILLGVLGLPCNKFLPDDKRTKIQISHRLNCASHLRKTHKLFAKTKLTKKFFDKLKEWVNKRNEYIHGLYKNELKYTGRIANAKAFSEDGLEYCRLLYNEVNRIKRLLKKSPDLKDNSIICKSNNCNERRIDENGNT